MGGEDHEHDHLKFDREALFKPRTPSSVEKFVLPTFWGIFVGPVVFFKEKIVDKIRAPSYPYYHQRYPRVPTIDQCFIDDHVCIVEANMQYMRDRLVDQSIIKILQKRAEECQSWYDFKREDVETHCSKAIKDHEDARTNFFIKYGDIHWTKDVREAYTKQKHRMLWERRHGPLGAAEDKRRQEEEEALEKKKDMFYHLGHSWQDKNLPKEMRR